MALLFCRSDSPKPSSQQLELLGQLFDDMRVWTRAVTKEAGYLKKALRMLDDEEKSIRKSEPVNLLDFCALNARFQASKKAYQEVHVHLATAEGRKIPRVEELDDMHLDDLAWDDPQAIWNRPDWFRRVAVYRQVTQEIDDHGRALAALRDRFYTQAALKWIDYLVNKTTEELAGAQQRIEQLTDRTALRSEYLKRAKNERMRRLGPTIRETFRGNSDEDAETCWVGGWPLGRGAFGTATLWLKQNHENTVIDRCVVKDTHITTSEGTWNDPFLWTNGLPNEIHAMNELKKVPDSLNVVVQIRNYRLRKEDRMYRIYMEYAAYGDVQVFGRPYQAAVNAQRRYGQPVTPHSLVPEPFLWHVFSSLAEAIHLMAYGMPSKDMEPREDQDVHRLRPEGSAWVEIIHRDLKLPNLVLSNPDKRWFQGYPTVKVADFGLAVMFPTGRPPSDSRPQPAGTPGHFAPEQAGHCYQGESVPRPLDSRTNVWGVGICLWSLMEGKVGHANMRWTIPEPPYSLEVREKYSGDLLKLVRWCLQYEQDQRPDAKQLLSRIAEVTDGLPHDHPLAGQDLTDGLRHAPKDGERWAWHRLKNIEMDRDNCPLGDYLGGMQAPPDWEEGLFPPRAHPKIYFGLTRDARQANLNEDVVDDGREHDRGITPRKRRRGFAPRVIVPPLSGFTPPVIPLPEFGRLRLLSDATPTPSPADARSTRAAQSGIRRMSRTSRPFRGGCTGMSRPPTQHRLPMQVPILAQPPASSEDYGWGVQRVPPEGSYNSGPRPESLDGFSDSG